MIDTFSNGPFYQSQMITPDIADLQAENLELSFDNKEVKSFFQPDFSTYTIRPHLPVFNESATVLRHVPEYLCYKSYQFSPDIPQGKITFTRNSNSLHFQGHP